MESNISRGAVSSSQRLFSALSSRVVLCISKQSSSLQSSDGDGFGIVVDVSSSWHAINKLLFSNWDFFSIVEVEDTAGDDGTMDTEDSECGDFSSPRVGMSHAANRVTHGTYLRLQKKMSTRTKPSKLLSPILRPTASDAMTLASLSKVLKDKDITHSDRRRIIQGASDVRNKKGATMAESKQARLLRGYTGMADLVESEDREA